MTGGRRLTYIAARLAAALVLGVLALAPGPLPAQSSLDRGLVAYRIGAYEQAVQLLEDAARAGPGSDRVVASRALARAHASTGDYDAALESLDRAARSLSAAALATVRGQVLVEVGRHNEALAAFDQAIEAGADDVVSARLARAELLWSRGGRTEAYRVFDGFIGLYNRSATLTAVELTAVGTAVRYLGRRNPALFHDAVRAYEEALRADPEALEPRVRMADLFLAKYNGGEAQTLYREVLGVNPRHPEALRGMARAKRFEGSSESLELAEAALEVNPSSPDSRALLALLRLEMGDDEAAVEEATRALATNPRHREALAVRAAARLLAGEQAAYRADRDRALELDPAYADFYVTVAELAVRRGRYREAVELAGEAVAVDSTAWNARAILGMNQLRLGQLDAARATLEAAYRGDPFNVWTFNTLDLMDRLANFETRRTARFELVLDPAEVDLLRPYMEPVAEEAYDALSERYGFEPEVPIRVEVYPDHDDFSVRTMGLTGLGALGVAFGNVLAMDSPAARDPGSFHWGSTLWHEIAHTFTLGMTRHRIPRWLTEGISVREERRSRPGWGEPVAFAFLQAFQQDLLLPMERIDAGFVRPTYPGQVGVSYQHASVVVELIENDHGPGAIRRMLDAYRGGSDTESVFRDVLGTGLDAFDHRLKAWVRERYADGLAAAKSIAELAGGQEAPPGVMALGADGNADGLVRRAQDDPDSFGAQLAAGNALFSADRADEAEPFLERALELYPGFSGPGSPYLTLAAIRQARGDRAGAVELLRRLTSMSESALAANTLLADLLMELDDPAGAAAALDRAVFIYPYDAAVHDRLAELAARLGRSALEVRERKAIVALEPVDQAGALYRLAVAHRRAGDVAAARRAVLSALEIAPAYAEAQDLLLDLPGGGE